MAQQCLRANLGSTTFPLVSAFMGRSVVVGQLDENFVQQEVLTAEDKDRGIPEVYYCENIVPTKEGYKSIGYDLINTIPGLGTNDLVNRIIAVQDGAGHRGFLAFTNTGRTFILSLVFPNWQELTSYVTSTPANYITTAFSTGTQFVCYSNLAIYAVNLITATPSAVLTVPSITYPTGVTAVNIVSICDTANYLIMTDGTSIYWSAAVNALSFTPSQTTGAGNGVPAYTKGSIIGVFPISYGFGVFSTENIVAAFFSGNIQYPWNFRELPNSSGISDTNKVAVHADEGSVYAFTSGGLKKVTLNGCIDILPEVTDFLGGRIYETFNYLTGLLSTQYLSSLMAIKLSFIGSRILCISYGTSDPDYTYCLLWDTALKRMGKVQLQHGAICDILLGIVETLMSYTTLGSTYSSYTAIPPNIGYDNLYTYNLQSNTPEAKHTMGIIQNNGTFYLVDFEYGNYTASGVLLLGKYQIERSYLCQAQEVCVENIDAANNNYAVSLITSYDGKNQGLPVTLTPREIETPSGPINAGATNVKEFYCRSTGVNHSLLIEGAFNLTSIELRFSQHGRR